MGLFFGSKILYDAITSELNRREENRPLFTAGPGATAEQANVTIAQAREYIRNALGYQAGAPIDYRAAEGAQQVRTDPVLAQYVEVLKHHFSKCPDIDDPDLIMTDADIDKYMAEHRIKSLNDKEKHLLRMQRYLFGAMDKHLVPELDEEKIRSFIEKYPRDPSHPKHLSVLSREERALRKTQFDIMRSVMTEYCDYSYNLAAKYNVDRAVKALLEYEDDRNIPNINKEIKTIFAHYASQDQRDAAREKMITDAMAAQNIDRAAAEQSVDAEIATYPARRALAVMRRTREAIAKMDDIASNFKQYVSDPQLLGQTYWTLIEASSIIYEADNFLTMSENGYIAFSDEDRKLLKDCMAMQHKYGAMVDRATNIANPCYQFLNLDELDNFNLHEIAVRYEDEHENRDRPLGEHGDFFTQLLDDITHHVDLDREALISDEYRKILDEYMMMPIDGDNRVPGMVINSFAENYDEIKIEMDPGDTNHLLYGQPVLYRHGDRTLIFTRADESDPNNLHLAINKPERFFNFLFADKNLRIDRLLNDADPAYIRSSSQFREMKSTFKRILQMPGLTGHSADEILTYSRAFSELLANSNAYLAYKGTVGKNDLEKSRIHVAQGMVEYAKAKLMHLDMVSKAARTLTKYYNLTPEQRREALERDSRLERSITEDIKKEKARKGAPAAGNIRPTREQNQQAMGAALTETAERKTQPVEWLGKASEKYIGIYSVHTAAGTQLNLLNAINKINLPLDSDVYPREFGAALVGAMVAGELVLAERAQDANMNRGPLETLFDGRCSGWYMRVLGEEAMIAATGKCYDGKRAAARADVPVISGEEFKTYMQTCDPTKLAAVVKSSFLARKDVRTVAAFADVYYNSIRPAGDNFTPTERALRKYVSDNIIKNVVEYCNAYADERPQVNIRCARELLADCVLCGMVQLERTTVDGEHPCRFETMMLDEKKTHALKDRILASEYFDSLANDILKPDADGYVSLDVLPNAILNDRRAVKAANDILTGADLAAKPKKQAAPEEALIAGKDGANMEPVQNAAAQSEAKQKNL